MELNCRDQGVDWYFDNGELCSERNIFVGGNVNVKTAMKVKLESDEHIFFFS